MVLVLLTRILALLIGVAQLRSCAAPVCSALVPPATTQTIRLNGPRVFDFAPLADGDLLVVSGANYLPPQYDRVIERWNDRHGSQPLFETHWTNITGEGIVAVDDRRWWYTVGGVYNNRVGTMFVMLKDGKADAPTFVPLPVPGQYVWLPLKGDVAQGLCVFLDHGTPGAIQVTPDGVLRRWTFAGTRMDNIGWWSAQLLPNGAIALAALERERLTIRILHDSGYDEIYDESADALGISMAFDGGTIAIVSRTRAQAVEAILMTPADAAHARRLVLTERGERGSLPRVARSADGFVVTWITGRDVRARSLTHAAAAQWPATIGPIRFSPDTMPYAGAAFDGRDLLFLWERGDATAKRRLAADLVSFELLSELAARLCS